MARYRTDPELIQRCLKGDLSAWDRLVEQYARLVYSIPIRYGMSEPDSEDVFQNVFATLLEQLGRLRDPTRLSAWLITTTHRECWRLANEKSGHVAMAREVMASQEPPDELAVRWEQQHFAREALRQLGDPCRSLLEALLLNPAEQSYAEIAKNLGMKVGSIGPTRARCFRKLEAILREMGYEE